MFIGLALTSVTPCADIFRRFCYNRETEVAGGLLTPPSNWVMNAEARPVFIGFPGRASVFLAWMLDLPVDVVFADLIVPLVVMASVRIEVRGELCGIHGQAVAHDNDGA